MSENNETLPVKEFPKIDATKRDLLDTVQDISCLETVPMTVQKMVDCEDGIAVLLDAEGETYIYKLTESEAAPMSFVASGCARKSFLPTIYEILKRTLEDLGMKLDRAVIEKKEGGMFLARLVYKDRLGRVLTTRIGVSDAITMSLLCKASLVIVRNVLEELVNIEDWPFANNIEDIETDWYEDLSED